MKAQPFEALLTAALAAGNGPPTLQTDGVGVIGRTHVHIYSELLGGAAPTYSWRLWEFSAEEVPLGGVWSVRRGSQSGVIDASERERFELDGVVARVFVELLTLTNPGTVQFWAAVAGVPIDGTT
jgi:hypothetical protein